MHYIVVVKEKKIVVTRLSNNQVALDATRPIPVLQQPLISNSSFRLDRIHDVVEGNSAVDGSTLIYHANTDTYVVEPLVVNVDGGSF